MTDIDITPEILRAAADWIDGCGHGLGPGHALREEAGRLERGQADEKRIDKLAEVFWAARVTKRHVKDADRAGIRAVLAKLDEEKAREDAVLDAMPRRISPAALTCYLLNPDRDKVWGLGSRTWQRQEDIPADVERVLDLTGDVMRRIDGTQDFMPIYHNGEDMGMDHVHRVDSPGSNNFAPFTELRKADAL